MYFLNDLDPTQPPTFAYLSPQTETHFITKPYLIFWLHTGVLQGVPQALLFPPSLPFRVSFHGLGMWHFGRIVQAVQASVQTAVGIDYPPTIGDPLDGIPHGSEYPECDFRG
jgi:hypothetical protein